MIILFTQKYDSWTLCGDEAYNKTEAAMTAKNSGYRRFLSNQRGGSPAVIRTDVNDKWNEIKIQNTGGWDITGVEQILADGNGGRMNMGMT